jgi:polysaccharide biosynthesis PFTS motif protein
LNLLAHHLLIFFAYVSSASRLPLLCLLGKDFAYSSISFALDRRGLIESIVLTVANHPAQALWMRALRRAKVHMIWYSQAAKQIVYASDNLDSAVPNYRWIRVDTHWVWTHAFAEYLGVLCHDKTIEVVGPIVWYLPKIKSPAKDTIEIVVFDVSPYSDEIALAYGEIPNYYHPNNLFSFVQDVISLRCALEKTFHLPVSFRLKTKRGYNAAYDKAYFDYLEKMDSQGSVSLEHHSANIYALISGSHLVIAYPFTSPPYIAEFLKVPSIYYDPTKSIVRDDFGDSPSLISFANTPESLLDAAVSALSGVFSKEAKATGNYGETKAKLGIIN